eukprot:scaffold36815_cov88-Skeletonema_marinoi.AAC.2
MCSFVEWDVDSNIFSRELHFASNVSHRLSTAASFSSILIIMTSIRSNCDVLFSVGDGPDDDAPSRCPEKYPNHDDKKPPPSLVLPVFTSCAPSVVARPSFALRFFIGLLLLSFMV